MWKFLYLQDWKMQFFSISSDNLVEICICDHWHIFCSFLLKEEIQLMTYCMSFFRREMLHKSTGRDLETWKLTTVSFLILLYKDGCFLLVLKPELCKSIQNALRNTCLWDSIKSVDHYIFLKSSKSKLKVHFLTICWSLLLFFSAAIVIMCILVVRNLLFQHQLLFGSFSFMLCTNNVLYMFYWSHFSYNGVFLFPNS